MTSSPRALGLFLLAAVVCGCNVVDIQIASPEKGAEVVVGEPLSIQVRIGGEKASEVQEVTLYQLTADSDGVLIDSVLGRRTT